jgi:uncharacterized protein YrrD
VVIKASDLIGRPVLVREGGREAGRVKDIVVDQPGRRVIGFVVSEGFLRSTRVAPWKTLLAIGPDAVILTSAERVVKVGDAPEIKAVLDAGNVIRGLRVQTTQGKQLGKIEDIHLNEQTGDVEGYELSGGAFLEAFGGRTFLPLPPSIELGKDVAFVAPEVESDIQQLGGGLRGAFRKHES